MEKIRKSNFELLRIISMIMIIGLHYLNGSMGGALANTEKGTLNYFFVILFESIFIMGVGTFVIITGYFSVNSRRIKLEKILDLLIKMISYGGLIYLVLLMTGVIEFNFKLAIAQIVPFIFKRRWFVITYIILMLFSPFINKFINISSKKETQKFLLIYSIFFVVWPSILPGAPNNDGGYGIITFILFYFIGGYIKKYNINLKNKIIVPSYILCIIVTTIYALIILQGIAWQYNFITNVIGSTMLFLIFMNFNFKINFINEIAKYTFVVFLIHSDFALNDFLYYQFLKTQNYWNNKLLIPHMFMGIVIMFVGSCIIHYLLSCVCDKLKITKYKEKLIFNINLRLKTFN